MFNVTVFEDAIDIALMNATGLHETLEQMQEDIENGSFTNNVFQEAAEEEFEQGSNFSGDFHSDELPSYSMSDIDMAADEFIDSYTDLSQGSNMDVGEMIDIIAAQK